MKIYQNPILTMLISGCQDCPHRIARRFKNNDRYYTGWVCEAINILHKNPITGREIATHPIVEEALMSGAARNDCPLEDAPQTPKTRGEQ
jgi:hypothetical protein